LWIRPRRLKEALVCSEILIAGGFALVVLDLGMAPLGGGRGTQSSWQRLQKAARDRKSTLLLSTPYRSSGAAASTVIEARKIATHWQGSAGSAKLLAALSSHMVLAKTRGRAAGAHEKLRLSFASGAVKSSHDNILMMPAGRSPSFRHSLLGRP